MDARTGKLFAVVPAYNEESTIVRVAVELLSRCERVVVVDDGSTDQTARLAGPTGATVLRHSVNLGQGAALQTGIDYALAHGAAYIATFDADGQHSAEDIAPMLQTMVDAGADVALGSRFAAETVVMPASRYWLLRLATAYSRWTTGLEVSDTHNGLRIFSRMAAEKLNIRQNGMAHASEILQFIADQSLGYVEVPVTVNYTAYSIAKGQSGFGSARILADLALEKLFK